MEVNKFLARSWRWNKSITWRCVAVSGKNVNQRKYFQHQLCLFSSGDGHLQKKRHHVIFT